MGSTCCLMPHRAATASRAWHPPYGCSGTGLPSPRATRTASSPLSFLCTPFTFASYPFTGGMRCFKMNYRIQDKRDLFWCCFSSCGSSSFPASEQWEAGIAVFQAHVKRTLLLPASECGPPISSLSTKNMRQLSPSLASYR